MAATDQHLDDYRFSASQISTWMECNRKWAWSYVVGIRPKSTGSQDLGTRIHAQIETYLNGGTIDFTTPVGEIVASGLEHVPLPSHDIDVEEEFVYQGRHKWIGYKDAERHHEVWDWKSTSDLKWAKTEQDLMYDPQAVLYAVENGSNPTHLHWVYFQTKQTRKSKHVHLPMLQSHARAAFECLEDAADVAMQQARGARGLDGEALHGYVLSLPYSAGACEKYGGCPFQGMCRLSPNERFKAKMSKGGGHMSLFERLKAKNRVEDKAEEPGINPPEAGAAEKAATQDAAYQAELARVKAAEKKAAKAAAKAAKAAEKAGEQASVPQIDPAALARDQAECDANEAAARARVPAAPPPGLTLYLDCLPISPKSEVTMFDDVVAKARARIVEHVGLADYRFAEFGQGPGILQQTVAQLLDEGVVTIQALVVDTRVPEAQVCLSLLRSRAKSIVQRF